MHGLRSKLLLVAVALCSTVQFAQACVNGTYYPSFNGTNNLYNPETDGFNVAQLVTPNFRQNGCFEQAVVNPLPLIFTNFSNITGEVSAKYYCNENGTRLTSTYYNESGCDGFSITQTNEVPFELDEIIVDCVCETTGKYIEIEQFSNISDYNIAECSTINEEPDTIFMQSGTCFGYYEGYSEKSMHIECNDRDEAVVWEYSNSLLCESSSEVISNNYTDDDCIAGGNVSWSFSCSGRTSSASASTDNKFSINKDDVIFLLIAFFYLIFVIVLLSVMFCYMTGKICVKKNKVGPDQDEDAIVEAIPIEKKETNQAMEGGEEYPPTEGGDYNTTTEGGQEEVSGETYQEEGVETGAVTENGENADGTVAEEGGEEEVPPEVQTEVQPEVPSEVQPEVPSEVPSEGPPEVQSEIQPEIQSEVQPEAQLEIQPAQETPVANADQGTTQPEPVVEPSTEPNNAIPIVEDILVVPSEGGVPVEEDPTVVEDGAGVI